MDGAQAGLHAEAPVDVVVVGSGGAGLLAACRAADAGATVCVLERSPLFGGSTGVSGGMAWVPNHHHLADIGAEDSPDEALAYLDRVAGGRGDHALLRAFVEAAPAMVAYLERATPLRFAALDRPDYHPEWEGARDGRTLEVQPCSTAELGPLAARLRSSPVRPPLTFAELRAGGAAAHAGVVAERRAAGTLAQGGALACGLLRGCVDRGIRLVPDARVTGLLVERGRVAGVAADVGGAPAEVRSSRAVVLASGGFEWSRDAAAAFLPEPGGSPATPPWNDGDGLAVGMRAGAALANMTEAWWTAAIAIPGERYDGQPLVRNVVSELALPGSIVVNRRGDRFVNEATNYHDLGKALYRYDPAACELANLPAWLVFDARFLRRYGVASIDPATADPAWLLRDARLEGLAARAGIDAAGLAASVDVFNRAADAGVDAAFRRGESRHDRFYGDPAHGPNPCLGRIDEPPFHAVPVELGVLGTKGGLRTDAGGRVLDAAGAPIPGLLACGNVAASAMGLGYPGAGGTLGPILTAAYLCGTTAAATAA